jgi:hypothetical protein
MAFAMTTVIGSEMGNDPIKVKKIDKKIFFLVMLKQRQDLHSAHGVIVQRCKNQRYDSYPTATKGQPMQKQNQHREDSIFFTSLSDQP